MLVISRKNGQKIMINDNIVITVVDIKGGQCKLAIEADKDVKIYREEIYYQIKLANLVSKNTNINALDSVASMLKNRDVAMNNDVLATPEATEIEVEKPKNKKSLIIKKNNNNINNG